MSPPIGRGDEASRASRAAHGDPAHAATSAEPSAQFTPGPWETAYRLGYATLVQTPGSYPIALTDMLPRAAGVGKEQEANAHLIAAAPELYEALKGAIGALEFSRDYHADLGNEEQAFAQDKLDAALRALRKAEGRQ